MSLDALEFKNKGILMRNLLHVFSLDGKTVAFRQANLQVESFIKMAEEYQDRFPPMKFIGNTSKNLVNERRKFKQRLSQKERLVDQSMRAVFEESMVKDLNKFSGPPITGKRIRSGVQKLMGRLNKEYRKSFHQSIAAGYEAARQALSGEK
jgi:hypothetical protein